MLRLYSCYLFGLKTFLQARHSRLQRLCSFCSAPGITTSGKVQFCAHAQSNPVSYSRPIRFVILDSEHVQSDGKSRGLRTDLPIRDQRAPSGADQKERGLWGREF